MPSVFRVARAEVVRLQLRDGRNTPLSVAAELLPALQIASGERPCEALAGGMRALGYRRVPHGAARLELQDEVGDGELRLLPFDPVAVAVVPVAAGRTNEIVLVVTPRAHVDLRACESGGREQLDARIELFACDRRVRSLPVRRRNRWRGRLPVGDYRAVIQRPAGPQEVPIVVGRDDLTMRLRP